MTGPDVSRAAWSRAWSLRFLHRTETLNCLTELRLRHGADLYTEELVFAERGHAVRVLDEFDKHVVAHGPLPEVDRLATLLDGVLLHEEGQRHASA